MSSLRLGDWLPSVSLPLTGGDEFSPTRYKGQYVVLFFYPRDATPGCTLEAHEFSNLKETFRKYNTLVFGVSRDSLKSHEKFKEKQGYSIELISDEEESFCNLFEVIKDKNMYGKKVRGIERSTFIIGPDGKLINEWRKVKVEGHADEVLGWIKSHQKSG